MIRARLTLFSLIGCYLIAAGALADPGGGSERIALKGAVDHPRTVTIEDLQKEPRTSETVLMHTGKGAVTGTFTGVSLWTLLREAGMTLDPTKKNDVIHHIVIVTGADGYSAVLSAAEIAPEFGGDQAIVAYQQDGKPLDGDYGFARLIIPSDKAAGRAVSAIASIEVK